MREDNFNKAWVFISHSNKDFVKVRRVRNEFEEFGHRPILFFLKCMDETPEEIFPLIKREIDAREWFLLCDSKNAKDSKYVRMEIEYIESLKGKVFEKIDLDDEEWEIQMKEKVRFLVKRATIFLSYARQDKQIAAKIIEALNKYEFGVYDPHKIKDKNGDVIIFNDVFQYGHRMELDMEDALDKGFFVLLDSPHARASDWVKWEIRHAKEVLREKKKITNLIIIEIQQNLISSIKSGVLVVKGLADKPVEENIARLIEYLMTVQLD